MTDTMKVELNIYENGIVTNQDMVDQGWVLMGADTVIISKPNPSDEELKAARIKGAEAEIAYAERWGATKHRMDKLVQNLEDLTNE